MRRTPAATAEFPELPLGRLDARTVQRVTTTTVVHHRAGTWAPCSEDFSRIMRIGIGLRPSAALPTRIPAPDATLPPTGRRRGAPAVA